MHTLNLRILTFLFCTSLHGTESSEPTLRAVIEQPWQTVKIGYDFSNDKIKGPVLLLHRMGPQQIVLSHAPEALAAKAQLPMPVAVIDDSNARKIIEGAMKHFAFAEATVDRPSQKSVAIVIEITGPNGLRKFRDKFAYHSDGGGADFLAFIHRTVGAFSQPGRQ